MKRRCKLLSEKQEIMEIADISVGNVGQGRKEKRKRSPVAASARRHERTNKATLRNESSLMYDEKVWRRVLLKHARRKHAKEYGTASILRNCGLKAGR